VIQATENYKAALLRASVGERADVRQKDIVRTEQLRQERIKADELERVRLAEEARHFAFTRNRLQ